MVLARLGIERRVHRLVEVVTGTMGEAMDTQCSLPPCRENTVQIADTSRDPKQSTCN